MIYISVLSQNLKLILTEASDTDKKFLDYRTELSGNVESNMTKIDDAFGNVQEHINDKTNPHKVTAEQIGADPAGSSDEALNNAKQYTDEQISNIPTPDVSGQINEHNISSTSHTDIRSNINQHKEDKNNPHDVTYEQVGADKSGSASTALESAKQYTDQKISAIPPVDISGKIDKIIDATQGNIPIISSDGQLEDGGKTIQELSNFVPVTGGEFSGDVSGKLFKTDGLLNYTEVSPINNSTINTTGDIESILRDGCINFNINGTKTIISETSGTTTKDFNNKCLLYPIHNGVSLQFGNANTINDKAPFIQFVGSTINLPDIGESNNSGIYCLDNNKVDPVTTYSSLVSNGLVPYYTKSGVAFSGKYRLAQSQYFFDIEDIYVYYTSTNGNIKILKKVIDGYLLDDAYQLHLESPLTFTEYMNSINTLQIIAKIGSNYHPILCYSAICGFYQSLGGIPVTMSTIMPGAGTVILGKTAINPSMQQTFSNINYISGSANLTCRCVVPNGFSINV